MSGKCFFASWRPAWIPAVALLCGCSGQVRSDSAAGGREPGPTAAAAAEPAPAPPPNVTPTPPVVAESAPSEPGPPASRDPDRSPPATSSAPPRPPAAKSTTPEAGLPPGQLPTVLGTISVFAAGTPDATLRAAFDCVQRDDFACYASLNVRSNRDGDISLAHLRGYQWRAFRERWASYVVRKNPFSLHITRRVEEPGREPRVKLFVFSQERDNPAPCIFAREDGVWRIYANSL